MSDRFEEKWNQLRRMSDAALGRNGQLLRKPWMKDLCRSFFDMGRDVGRAEKRK